MLLRKRGRILTSNLCLLTRTFYNLINLKNNKIMSETEVNGADEEVQDKKQKKQTRHDGGAADLERVTDYAEEKEMSAAAISNAVEQFGNKRSKEDELKVAKEKELQKVQVKKEDIELIMNELLVTKTQAEKVLREQSGDVVAALQAIVSN